MGDLGKLCYKHGNGSLAYKKDEGSLVYKSKAGDWTMVSFAWGSDGKDLDICAYWDGASGMQMGYGHNTSTSEQVQGAYHIVYSGDITSTDSSEWCKIRMNPWASGARTFKVHFNYYGYNGEKYPLNTCTVIASQQGGETRILRDVACGTAKGQAAQTSDSGVVLTFDAKGTLTSLEAI